MLTRTLLLAMTVAVVACQAPDASPPTAVESEVATTVVRSVEPSPPPSPQVEARVEWAGFEATRTRRSRLAAFGFGPLDVYGTWDASTPRLTLEEETILGTPTVVGLTGESRGGRVEVQLPVRPNGSTGWVDVEDVGLYVVDSRIRVDLTARELVYEVDGREVLRTEVGIGSVYNATPTGQFFVTDSVTLANPASPWGPHAFGISARSDTITEYNGGDGIIGIHGTNNPSSIGGNISLGCVRLPNDTITALYGMVPIGTPVDIEA